MIHTVGAHCHSHIVSFSDEQFLLEPDAGIVNFYQERDTLMGHVDRSELSSTTPLVSISYDPSILLHRQGAD